MSTEDLINDAPPPEDSQETPNETRKNGTFTCIIHVDYVKSRAGIVKVFAALVSFAGFICLVASDWCYPHGPYRFFQFVTQAAYLSTIPLYAVYVMGVDAQIKSINWPLTELVWSALHALFFLISSIILAANICRTASLKTGAAFGFFAMFAFGYNAFLAFGVFRKHAAPWRSARQRPFIMSKY